MQTEGVVPDKVTFISILDACSSPLVLTEGREIHALITNDGLESDVVVVTALVDMYGKCGSITDARITFCKMSQRNEVSWNAMISSYAQNGTCKEALEHFYQMQAEGFKPDKVTFISVLDACGNLAALAKGKDIHVNIIDLGFQADIAVATALVNMYGRCGSLQGAKNVFAVIPVKDLVAWNAVISACALNGQNKEALELFSQMQVEGIKPDKITFVSILTACSHSGMVEAGRRFFASMMRDHGIIPVAEHYVCMIDILGRAGQLEEPEVLINIVSIEDAGVIWLSLLSLCKNHGDVERAVRAANHVFELDPTNASAYVTLANTYAAAGRWDDVIRVRNTMKNMGLSKNQGAAI